MRWSALQRGSSITLHSARRLLGVLSMLGALGAVVLGVEGRARAGGPQEQQLAQALFDEARRLMEKGRFAEACPKLAESQRLDPGGGTLLNLAICHEKEGKLATAKVDFDEALAAAARDGRKDRQQIAREHVAAIDAATPRLSVMVPPASDAEGLEVKLDGLVLRRAAWGVSTPVDPGAHVIEARAPNRASWTTNVLMERAQKKAVEIPALGPALSTLPPADTAADVGGGLGIAPSSVEANVYVDPPPIVDVPAPPVPAAPTHPNPVFYAALASTVVAASTSAVTGVLALNAKSDARAAGCIPDRHYCPSQAAYNIADRATTMAWVSTVTLGVAVIAAVTTMIAPTRAKSKLRGVATPGGAAFELGGTF